jgi:5'-methylthioadenosine phosphorylase/5'-methylthioinosine phosphorylase
MSRIAVIGGSGFSALAGTHAPEGTGVATPYGLTSAPIVTAFLAGREVLFLPRHGPRHQIAPHRINYRANVWAIKDAGARYLLALAAVGGIGPAYGPGVLAVPDQIIDYTYEREHSFYGGDDGEVVHTDFTYPYCEELRQALLRAGRIAGLDPVDGGTYGATQGPRLETAAEVIRLERDGCDLVGMTGMPEAALSRELGLCYACCAFVVNWAAGKAEGEIRMEEIEANLAQCNAGVGRWLEAFMQSFDPGARASGA